MVNLIVRGGGKAPADLSLDVGAVSYGGPITDMFIYSDSGTLFELHGAALAPYNDAGTFSYQYTWKNVAAGTYTLWAGVQSNLGSISKKVTITIDAGDVGVTNRRHHHHHRRPRRRLRRASRSVAPTSMTPSISCARP